MEKDRIFKTTLRLYRDNSNHQKALKCLEDYNKDIFKNLNNYIAEAIIYYSSYLKQHAQEAELKSIEQILKQNREFFKEIVAEALNDVKVEKQEADIPKEDIKQEEISSVIDDNFMSFYIDEGASNQTGGFMRT